jgi:HSP20 family protein
MLERRSTMNLLKRWRKQEHGNGGSLVRHRSTDRGLFREFLDPLEEALERFRRPWLDFERDPWSGLMNLPSRLAELSRWNWPAIDMAEDEHAVTLRVDAPGLDEKHLEVEVSGNVLTVRGSRQDEWKEQKQGLRRQERVCGQFVRSITLPSYVDTEKVEARYEKGTLTITIPRIPGKGPRRVQIRAG